MLNAPLLAGEGRSPRRAPSPASAAPRSRRSTRYRVLRQLGQDELTRSFLAAKRGDVAEPALVRLELLRKELAAEADVRALFIDHATAALSLRHPRLAATRGVVDDSSTTGLVAEFVDGQPLDRILEQVGRSELPLALHLRILCDVLDGLHHAHRHRSEAQGKLGLVHGDLSPSQVFVTYDGSVKVIGVGLAAPRHAVEKKRGTPERDVGYRAPELFLGYGASPAADVYGVGVMLWEALAQCRRSLALDVRSVAKRRTRGEEPDIDEVSTGAPKRLRAICRRALAVSRRDRYQTALELEADLEAYLEETSAPSAEAASTELGKLLRARFEQEREEMELFIGSSLAAPAAAASTTTPELSEMPPKSSDSGEHRAFAASLTPAPSASRAASRRSWLLAAAGVALVAAVSARWLEHARAARSASTELALRATPPAVESASATALPSETTAAGVSAASPSSEREPSPPSALPLASASPKGSPAPSAFLELSANEELTSRDGAPAPVASAQGTNEPPAIRADELPAIDDERTRLQEALVDAARRYRARLARREAARRAALRAAAQAAAEAPPAAPIVEDNPYDP